MSEKMNWSEAEAVVRAFRAEQGATADVDVAALARALGTDVGEIRRLAGRKPRFVDRSGVLSAGIALAVVAFGTLTLAPSLLRNRPARTTSLIAPPPAAFAGIGPSGVETLIIAADGDGKVLVYHGDGKAPEEGVPWSYPGDEKTKL